MAKSYFKWDKTGYEALQRSEVGRKAVEPHVQRIAASANAQCSVEGGAYEGSVKQGTKGRRVIHGVVSTANYEAMVDNADNNTLAKALGGA